MPSWLMTLFQSGSATVMRPWSMLAAKVRYAIRRKPTTRGASDKVGKGLRACRNSAAAEAAVGLALIIAIYRHYKTTNVNDVNELKG